MSSKHVAGKGGGEGPLNFPLRGKRKKKKGKKRKFPFPERGGEC